MSPTIEEELKAEIEAFRAEVRAREERRQRERRVRDRQSGADASSSLLDVMRIDDLISQRYENARLRKQLEAAEQRIAELERRRNG